MTAQRPLPLLSKAALGHTDKSCLRAGPLHVHTLHSLEDVVVYTRYPTVPLASPGFSSEEDSTLLVPYRIKRRSNNYNQKKKTQTLFTL